ncbi:MAG: CMP deaminase [Candidatus Peribacteria bacterium]|jgi:dCMP deaminase|nr:CMP deaminase [Candidatus Peribacteria bacterium]
MNKIEYMLVAELMKRNSQNPKTQTGCCIVDVEGNVIGKGTNALPRGLELTEDDKKRLVEDNDYALNLLEHAERNAIFNAIDNGKVSSLKGSTLYVAYTPCVPCAQAIIAVGIAKVVDF